MKNFLSSLGCALFLLSPSVGQAFTLANGVQVNAVSDTVFEVVPRSSGTVEEFWCGASEYARRVLGADWRDPIYVLRGRGESVTTGKRSAVQFTLSADQVAGLGADRGWFSFGIRPGDSMSVQQARTYCNQRPIRP